MKKNIVIFIMIFWFISYSFAFQWTSNNNETTYSNKTENIQTNLSPILQIKINNIIIKFIDSLNKRYNSPLLKSKKILSIIKKIEYIKKTNISPFVRNIFDYLEQKLIW